MIEGHRSSEAKAWSARVKPIYREMGEESNGRTPRGLCTRRDDPMPPSRERVERGQGESERVQQ